jgi:hypothetical protein
MDIYPIQHKYCNNCNQVLSIDNFYRNKDTHDGFYTRCKECHRQQTRKYRHNNQEKVKQFKSDYYQNNKDRYRMYNKTQREKNPELFNEKQRAYARRNKDILNQKRREKRYDYEQSRKIKDPLYKLKCSIGKLISVSLRSRNYTKKSRTYEILGCSYEEFKLHIERQFIDGMNWENKGRYGWHIDHIKPLCLASSEEELIQLNHYTNLQPLWWYDNLKKGKTYNSG